MANLQFEFLPAFESDQAEVGIGDYVRVFKRSEQPFEEPEVIGRALLKDYCGVFIEIGATPPPAPAAGEPKRKR